MVLMCGCQGATEKEFQNQFQGISLAVWTLLSHLQEPEFDPWIEN